MRKLLILAALFLSLQAKSQTPKDYFEAYAPWAQLVSVMTGIPPSVQLAQAFNETYFGQADTIGRLYNNAFAIKALEGDGWSGKTGTMLDAYGQRVCTWRVYEHIFEAWIDYTEIVKLNAPAGHFWRPWCYWVDNPIKYGGRGYWNRVQTTIEKYELYRFDYKEKA